MDNPTILMQIEDLLQTEFYPLQEKLHNSPLSLIELNKMVEIHNRMEELCLTLNLKELGFNRIYK